MTESLTFDLGFQRLCRCTLYTEGFTSRTLGSSVNKRYDYSQQFLEVTWWWSTWLCAWVPQRCPPAAWGWSLRPAAPRPWSAGTWGWIYAGCRPTEPSPQSLQTSDLCPTTHSQTHIIHESHKQNSQREHLGSFTCGFFLCDDTNFVNDHSNNIHLYKIQ